MAWRVARSLEQMKRELDKKAPRRSTASDGTIGDAAHASRTSDHNPWIKVNGVGVVRARDVTHDPAGGMDCNWLARHLDGLLGKHPAMMRGSYIIWNRRIKSYDRRSEGWRTYTGSNPHSHHLHVSVTTIPSGFDSLRSWGIAESKEDDMNEAQDKRLKNVETMVKELKADFDTFRTREHKRDDLTKERLRKLIKQGNVTQQQLEELIAE